MWPATWPRPICGVSAHVNIATSLLAQVDAAVGGKTGVNTRFGKNLIGAFHQPRAVIIDVAALESLPEQELRNGLAEAVKHAVLGDAALFETIERWASTGGGPNRLRISSSRCVQIKAEVVEQDERESAYRQVLNFGHTVAHALEAASDHQIQHGEAVAMGMVVEAHLAVQMCGFPAAGACSASPVAGATGVTDEAAVALCSGAVLLGTRQEDPRRHGSLLIAERIGQMLPNDGAWAVPVALEALEQALDRRSERSRWDTEEEGVDWMLCLTETSRRWRSWPNGWSAKPATAICSQEVRLDALREPLDDVFGLTRALRPEPDRLLPPRA